MLQNGNFGGFLGNSNSKFRVGKNVGDVEETQVLLKIQAKPVAQKFSRVQTKSINTEKQIYQLGRRISPSSRKPSGTGRR